MQIARGRPRDAAGLPPSLEMSCYPIAMGEVATGGRSPPQASLFRMCAVGNTYRLQIGARRLASCVERCQAPAARRLGRVSIIGTRGLCSSSSVIPLANNRD
jgi:hypothetical protein